MGRRLPIRTRSGMTSAARFAPIILKNGFRFVKEREKSNYYPATTKTVWKMWPVSSLAMTAGDSFSISGAILPRPTRPEWNPLYKNMTMNEWFYFDKYQKN